MATHFNPLAWEIPWTEEPGGLQSMGLQRVGQDWATENYFYLVCKCHFPVRMGCTLLRPGDVHSLWCLLILPAVLWGGWVGKNPPAMQETLVRFLGLGRSAGEGIGYLLQYSWTFLVAQLVKNPLQWGRPGSDPSAGKIPWRRERLPTSVFWYGEFHGVAKSRTSLSNFHFHFHCPKVFLWHPACLDVPRP